MAELRDFLYLDTGRLHSFVSQISGGLVSEIIATIKRLGGVSAGVEIGIPPVSGRLGGTKESEDERQQTIQLTDPAYFAVLYQYLQGESKVSDITGSSFSVRDSLRPGQFVEMRGVAEPPVVEYWIARIRALVDFLDRNLHLMTRPKTKGAKGGRADQKLSRRQMDLFKEMVNFLDDFINISRRDPGKQYIRVAREHQPYGIWCGLLPEYVTVPLEATLPTQVNVFGRVERLLEAGEVFRIVDFSSFSQTADIEKLLDALNALGPFVGQKQIKETDLQAEYPDVFVAPIAIYR